MLKGFFTDTNPLTGKATYYKTVFYSMMVLSVLTMFVALWETKGECARSFLFVGGVRPGNSDTFMDFFNSIVNTYNNPYDAKVIYPAVCSLIFSFLRLFIRPSDFAEVVTDPNYPAQPPELKMYQSFMFTYIIFSLIVLALFFLAVNALMRNRSNGEKTLMAFFCLFSAPFLFLIERGNILVLSLVFAMLFVAYYDHKSKVIRELALICLAVSISIKIYPAVFGVILLNEKRYKELVRAIIYTLIVFFLPFAFFGGIEGVSKFIRNITSTSSGSSINIDFQLNFQKFPIYIGHILESTSTVWVTVGKVMMLAFAVIGVLCLFVSKSRWKTFAICTCLLIGVPSMSARYVLTFFIIPIILIIVEEKENNWLSYLSLVIMGAIMFVKPLNFMEWSDSSRLFGYKIDSFLYIGLFVILCIDAIVQFVKRVRCKNEAYGCAEGE